jgi:hypothetical protein
MTKDEFNKFIRRKFDNDILDTSKSGQSEYALSQDAFDNFNRLATELGVSRQQVLLVYFSKHRDGVISYIKGHKSQREPVQGRIKDMIVYLFLLWGMVEEEETTYIGQEGYRELVLGKYYRKTDACGPHEITDFCSTCSVLTSPQKIADIEGFRKALA